MTPNISFAAYTNLLKIRSEAKKATDRIYSHRWRVSTEVDRTGEFVTQLRRLLAVYIGDLSHEAHKEAVWMIDKNYWLAPNIPAIPWVRESPSGGNDMPTLEAFASLVTEAQAINIQADILLAEMTVFAQQLEE